MTSWPSCSLLQTCASFWPRMCISNQHFHFWRKAPPPRAISTHFIPTLNPPKNCIRFLVVILTLLVWLPTRFLWIHKELASIMNRPTQLLTPLYITRLYCSVPTMLSEFHYLSCAHLFACSLIQGLSFLPLLSPSSPKLSIWTQEGGMERGKRWEDCEKLERNSVHSGTHPRLCVTVACVHLNVSHICLSICFLFIYLAHETSSRACQITTC